MLLVIAFMIIVAVYVGYTVTQRPADSADGHSVPIEVKTISNIESIQIFSKSDIIAISI